MRKPVLNGPRDGVVLFLITIIACGVLFSSFGQTNAPASELARTNAITVESNVISGEILRAYLQLQEQMHEAQLAIQRAGQQSELAAMQNTAMLSNRLEAVERTVEMQRAHELQVVRNMVLIAGAFVVVGIVALLFTAYFHWRAVSRLAEIAAVLPATRPENSAAVAALGSGAGQLLLEQTNSRLVGAIERLEKRISQIEQGGGHASNGYAITNGGGEPGSAAAFEENSVTPPRVMDSTHAEQFVQLVTRGQVLLNEDKAGQALECFSQALELDPRHAELLVKKGDALEKLRRPDEAIQCYDQAIAIDESLTIAFLHKGGLLNRLERFDEAMHCYEQALRTQEKKRVG